METKKIADLAKILKQNQLTKLDLTEGDTRIVLEAAGGKPVPMGTTFVEEVVYGSEEPSVAVEEMKDEGAALEGCFEQKSPLVGTIYLAPQAGAAPFVQTGDKVEKGDPVCIVESMKMFNTIGAEVSGVIEEVSVDNGQIVEYGQVLVRIREEA